VATPLAVLVGDTLPHAAAEQETLQVTPLLLASFVTVAVKGCVVPAGTVAVAGATDTVIPVSVTVAEAVLLGSAWATAVMVTVGGLGRTAGAVYRPVKEMVPTVALPPMMPFTSQNTAVLVTPVTVAVNCCVLFTCTVADVGVREIMTVKVEQPATNASTSKQTGNSLLIIPPSAQQILEGPTCSPVGRAPAPYPTDKDATVSRGAARRTGGNGRAETIAQGDRREIIPSVTDCQEDY